MSVVIRGTGSVRGPLLRCQSFSASTRFPRSARSRKIPLHEEHWLTGMSPRLRVVIGDPHLGQVISSTNPTILANSRRPEYEHGYRLPRYMTNVESCR